jgi:GNAT superfamily N-acetyltransferase
MESSDLRCEQIEFGSVAYRETLKLREDVLRKPLDLTWEPGAFDGEEKLFHLGCFENGKLVGSLILKPIDANTLKMRQVAVANDQQSRGIGSVLVKFAEEFASAGGFVEIVANARKAALKFYERLDYQIEGDEFTEVGIPHRFIRKKL